MAPTHPPSRIGKRVTILETPDDGDDIAPVRRKWIGKKGTIVALAPECVGNSARDPLYVVHVKGLGRESFWAEELS